MAARVDRLLQPERIEGLWEARVVRMESTVNFNRLKS